MYQMILFQKSAFTQVKLTTELIREKIYQLTQKEIPYLVDQETLGWTKLKDGTLRIDQIVYVEKESQKVFSIFKNFQKVNYN